MGNLIAAVSRGGGGHGGEGGAWVPVLLCLYCMHACKRLHGHIEEERERQDKSGESGENHIEPARRAARRTAGSRGRVNWPQLPFSKVLSKIQNSRLGGAAIWVGSRDTGHWRNADSVQFLLLFLCL